MRFQIVFSDLDGTLLSPDKRISPANRDAIGAVRASGARFALASGRRHQNSVRFYRELGLDTPLISCAGALIKDPQTGETLREVLLPAPLAAELVNEGINGGFSLIYYHRDHLFIARRDRWTDLYESRAEEQAEICDLPALQGEAALKIVWYGEPALLQKRRPSLQERFAGRATVISTDAENLEFSAPGANKAEALATVVQLLGLDRAATVALGDGENDVPMLDWAGLGIAMDHGPAREQSAAARVSPAGPPEESFARAVREFILPGGVDPRNGLG